MQNITEDGNYTSELNQTRTPTWITGAMTFLSALNIFLSITASLGNALILFALHKESSLHPPTKLLFRCLAVTDLCVGLVIQPLFASILMARTTRMNRDVLNYLIRGNFVSSYSLCGVSILTSTAISVDRLLALLLGIRYRLVVTLRRVRAVIICFCLISVSGGLLYLWIYHITDIVAAIFVIFCLVTSIFSYLKIYLRLRQHQAQVQEHVNQRQPSGGGIPLNIARYKKTVSSICWVQLALVACFTPFIVASLLLTMLEGIIIDFVWLAASTLVYLNSSLNPFIYCWKIKEVRQAAMDTIKQFCCFCRFENFNTDEPICIGLHGKCF